MSVSDITAALELQTLGGRKWFVSGTCATTGEGLYEGLDWLSQVQSSFLSLSLFPRILTVTPIYRRCRRALHSKSKRIVNKSRFL